MRYLSWDNYTFRTEKECLAHEEEERRKSFLESPDLPTRSQEKVLRALEIERYIDHSEQVLRDLWEDMASDFPEMREMITEKLAKIPNPDDELPDDEL